MTKLINNHSKFGFFIVILTLLVFISCTTQKPNITRVKGKIIPIDQSLQSSSEYDNYIAPYRNHINKDLDSVLSYAPQDMDKSHGKWQTTIGNFLADITLEKANLLFEKSTGKSVDICLLNHGGIRAPIPKGNVTARTAYQIMPFENSLIIAELKAEQIVEMVDYFVQAKRAHPIAGIQIELSNDQKSYKNILIQGELLNSEKTYFVATSDYLMTGGDNMIFFEKAVSSYDMNYKLRNLIIDYFKENDTIPVLLDNRVK
jgi:2',3'-cyclic-nucleotide 2'-phosphodiesterase (5'-nucleotidase family)